MRVWKLEFRIDCSVFVRYNAQMKASIKSFHDLIAWQEAHKLVIEIYKLLIQLPVEEKFGLCTQLQRAAVSIPSNIAEGFGRKSTKERVRESY